MALILIAEQIVTDYPYTGVLHELWIATDRPWFAQDGTPIQFLKKVTIAVVGSTATVPALSLHSQNDAPNERGGSYQAYFYVDGAQKEVFLSRKFTNFQVPSTPATTTWQDLETFNSTARRDPQDWRTYTAVQLNEMFAAVYAAIAEGDAL